MSEKNLLNLKTTGPFFQDQEMQALFKNDQFSVEGELARRQQGEGGPVNPAITRDRPIFDENLDYGSRLPAKGEQRFGSGPGKVQVGLIRL